jgi:hypothetical protein
MVPFTMYKVIIVYIRYGEICILYSVNNICAWLVPEKEANLLIYMMQTKTGYKWREKRYGRNLRKSENHGGAPAPTAENGHMIRLTHE